jgi:hypothetical protein
VFGQLQAERVVTGTAAVNQASRRLLERLGFQKIGQEVASFRAAEDGKPIEFLGYRLAISRDERENMKSSVCPTSTAANGRHTPPEGMLSDDRVARPR